MRVDHSVLWERIVIEGFLETVTGLRIGTSRGGAGCSDMPVLRDGTGKPLIPGSSIKGVLRATVESLVRGLGVASLTVSDAFDTAQDLTIAKTPGADIAKDIVHGRLGCTVKSIFGLSGFAGRVRISDATSLMDGGEHNVVVRDGVGIHRDRRIAAHRKKYDFEVVPPGTRFRFRLEMENMDPWERGLVFVALRMLNEGSARLGGMSSRGLGEVRVCIERVRRITPRSLVGLEEADLVLCEIAATSAADNREVEGDVLVSKLADAFELVRTAARALGVKEGQVVEWGKVRDNMINEQLEARECAVRLFPGSGAPWKRMRRALVEAWYLEDIPGPADRVRIAGAEKAAEHRTGNLANLSQEDDAANDGGVPIAHVLLIRSDIAALRRKVEGC